MNGQGLRAFLQALESKSPEYLDSALRDLLARLPSEAVVRVQ